MPTVAPAWFQWQTYFDNKLAQCQANDPTGEWTEAKLEETFTRDGFTLDADGMYRHFQEYGNTPAENVSPNEYFDVAYYMAAKLAQCQADDPEGNWTPESLAKTFQDANLSAWDHYTLYGQFEGLNPSAYFNTDEYMNAKLAQCESNDPSGEWTMDKLDDVFKADHINPIMHWDLWGKDEDLGYTPGTPPEPSVVYTEFVDLTPGQDDLTGKDGENTLFQATSETLQQDDQLDGGAGENGLKVEMTSSFRGFTGVETTGEDGATATEPNISNIQHVYLENSTPRRAMNFNAQNMDGVEEWTINDNGSGPISLTNLAAAGQTVNIQNLASGTTTIGYAKNAVSGTDDALTLGLENVGTSKAVKVNAAGIETITVNSAENTSSAVDLSENANLDDLVFTGAGNVSVTAVDKGLQSVDAGAATGNINVNLSSAGKLDGIKGGSGNDTFVLNAGIHNLTPIDGGEGFDTVAVDKGTLGASPSWTSIENIQVGKGAAVSISAQHLADLTTLTLANGANASSINMLEVPELNIKDSGANSAMTLRGDSTDGASALSDIVYDVVAPTNGKKLDVSTTITTNASSNVTVNVPSATNAKGAELVTFGGTITDNEATGLLDVNADGNLDSAFNVSKASEITVDAAKGGQMSLVSGKNAGAVATITSHGDFGIRNAVNGVDTDLQGIVDFTLNQYGGQFEIDVNEHLSSASTVTLNGFAGTDDTNVILQDIGSTGLTEDINVTSSNFQDVTIGNINNKNADITVNLDNGNGTVTLGAITSNGSDAGDVTVTVEAIGDVTMTGATGATVTVDMSQVAEGDVTINTTGLIGDTVIYTGSYLDDTVKATISGEDSVINLGSGTNSIDLQAGAASETSGLISAAIDVSAGVDAITVAAPTVGHMALTVSGFGKDGANSDTINGTFINTLTDAQIIDTLNAWLQSGLTLDSGALPEGVAKTTDGYGITYGGNTYYFNSEATTATAPDTMDLMVELVGVTNATCNGSMIQMA